MTPNLDGMGMEHDSNLELSQKLDRVLRLLAIMAVKSMPQVAQIATLSRAGFSPKEIAEILGTTANTVRVALVGIRKAEGHRSGRLSLRAREGLDV
jgi:DNA-binding NarL/FixJ family response regulator